MVIAKGGAFKDVSVGVTPAASAADALAAAAGGEAVPAPAAAEAAQEKAEAAAEPPEDTKEGPQVRCDRLSVPGLMVDRTERLPSTDRQKHERQPASIGAGAAELHACAMHGAAS
jgi:hypothetical protein